MIRRVETMLALAIGAAVLGGCGYTQTELFPEGYRSVAVPIFQNRSFYRGIEFDVTEALTKEIELRTPYKVVGQGGADTQLEGTIVRVDQRQLSRRVDTGVPQEMEVVLVVDFVWKDQQSGQVLRQRQGFEVVGRYVPTHPVGEPFQVAQHEAARRLAEQVVSIMRADW